MPNRTWIGGKPGGLSVDTCSFVTLIEVYTNRSSQSKRVGFKPGELRLFKM